MAAVLAYAACALIWGTTWFAIRVSIGDGGYPTFAAAALRFTLAALILVPAWWIGALPGPRNRRQLLWLAAAGIFNATGYALVYLGEERIQGGLAAVLFGTMPIMAAVLATLTRTERVSRWDLWGAAVALAGIALIFWDRLELSTEQAVGVVMVLAAVVASAGYSLIFKREARDLHPLASTALFLVVTAAGLWVIVLLAGWEPLPWPPPAAPSGAIVYLAVFGSVVAFASYFFLLKRVTLMTTTTLVFVQPVIALVVDALLEPESSLTLSSYAGAAFTLLGVMIALVLKQRRWDARSSARRGT